MNVTDEMIAAAWDVWREEGEMPYMARVEDHVEQGSTGNERARQIASLHAADLEAERLNDDLMRRTIAAALEAM